MSGKGYLACLDENGDNNLLAVAVAGRCDVWVVGSHSTAFTEFGQTLIEHWTGGSSWTVVPSPNGVPDIGNRLVGVSVVSPADIWAVGDQTLTPQGDHGGLVAHWDGTSWTKVPV